MRTKENVQRGPRQQDDGNDGKAPLHQMNPRFDEANRPMFGNTVARLPLSTPNQVARVAKYWSMAVVGIQRHVLVSLGPLMVSAGKAPKVRWPLTAPPMMRWWLPQPWSLPWPLLGK